MEKRGQGLSISTIISLIIALLVLIVILVIFWGPARQFFTTLGNQIKNALNLFEGTGIK